MRLFVSIDLPDDLAEAIAEVQAEIESASGLRMTDPTQAHLTVKFLGDTDPARVEDIIEGLHGAVDQAGCTPFEASVEGLGVFPELSYINVVWVGIERGAAEITELHAAVERELTDRGFEPAEHDFTPHITIARMDHAGGKEHVQRVVTEHNPSLGTMTVDSIALTESTLTAAGPEYETIEAVPLLPEHA